MEHKCLIGTIDEYEGRHFVFAGDVDYGESVDFFKFCPECGKMVEDGAELLVPYKRKEGEESSLSTVERITLDALKLLAGELPFHLGKLRGGKCGSKITIRKPIYGK